MTAQSKIKLLQMPISISDGSAVPKRKITGLVEENQQ